MSSANPWLGEPGRPAGPRPHHLAAGSVRHPAAGRAGRRRPQGRAARRRPDALDARPVRHPRRPQAQHRPRPQDRGGPRPVPRAGRRVPTCSSSRTGPAWPIVWASGYDAVSARNPADRLLLDLRLRRDRAAGPGRPATTSTTSPASGVLAPGGRRRRAQPTIPIGDLGGGIAGAFGIVTAVLGARATGRGERVDVPVTDVLATWVGPGRAGADGRRREAAGRRCRATACSPRADGGHVAHRDHERGPLLGRVCAAALDLPPRRPDQRRAQPPGCTSSTPRSPPPSARSPQADALDRLARPRRARVAAVLDRDGMLEHPHFRERGTVVDAPRRPADVGPAGPLRGAPRRSRPTAPPRSGPTNPAAGCRGRRGSR